ncbi:hypothetical protein JOB18_046260 [Solea senegalensis]|uniref:RNA helicase n=1 Tax=Solea senegalensis TaxID=28829 RepID=A0AAV6QU14_SOLSE|nr:putative helicase mov-10-B.1 [Solea senegalensis]KAG7495212.1 hypothetical protein JOB18_046260 [Solea senegalensis]
MPSSKALEYGRDFFDFLGDRRSITHEIELKRIYDFEFMCRRGNEGPQFSTVISALLKAKKAYKTEGRIYLNDIKVQVNYDQWRRRPRASQSHSSSTQSTAMMPAASSNSPTLMAPVLTSEKKLAAEVLHKLKTEKKTLKANKGGIEITSDPEEKFGRVRLTVDGLGEYVIKFLIVNKGADSVHFTLYTVLHQLRCFTLKGKSVTRAAPLLLCSGESYEVEVWCKLKDYGYFPTTIYFEFCPSVAQSAHFCIVREIAVGARTSLAKELGSVVPYKPHEVIKHKPVKKTLIEEGVPPEYSGVYCLMEMKLGSYRCPHYLKELAKQRLEDSSYLSPTAKRNLQSVRSLLQSSLEMQNYSQRFHPLLHLEELQMEVDIGKYDLHDQTMSLDPRNRDLVTLNVPGVAEKRPSVFRGSCVRVSKSQDTEQPVIAYTGYIHKVELDTLKLGFSKRFLQIFRDDIKFDVEFVLHRLTLKLQHRAVDLAQKHGLGEVLFPSGPAVTRLALPKLSLFNHQLENNPEQCAAIQHIVAGSSKPAPHLVFGPPGTGKTMTLVEAIHQVSKADSSVHILACTPQNAACDELWQRLIPPMGPHNVYRLCALNRDLSSVPRQLLTYCNWDQSKDGFVFPKKEVLMKHKVIVTTMLTAGRLVSGGIPVGHFTHVFVDEGGQAVEPECVIAVAGLLDPGKGQLVLAGDHKQLGPIIHSPLALNNGLGLSLLERLMKTNTLYEKNQDSGHFDSRFVTKLLRNYRSHGAFLKIPNELFYDNELQEFADREECQAYCKWRHLPQEGFPLIFHGVMGKEEREHRSPSWFNVTEIDVVVDYLIKLKKTQGENGLPNLHAKDIGIVAPFRKQIEKIKKALQSAPGLRKWTEVKEIKVGCVEEFQGQERKIIIISTVRSSDNYVKMDKDFNIGFLSNEKRFNVAVTRARSLLIVVGNPVILSKNPTWKTFISYCVRQNGYRGIEFQDKGEDDVLHLLMVLKIRVDNNPVADEKSVQQLCQP